MKFEEWFYQDKTDEHKPVNDFDRTNSTFFFEMENFLRKAYEAGHEQGLKDHK
jgi:hypothetical protein